jgi:hypothetical protein
MTGMMEIRFDKELETPYISFVKNRRGQINKRLYYSLKESGHVSYFEMDYGEELENEE